MIQLLKTMQPEHKLIMSNLVFATISQLDIRHLEIIKKVNLKGVEAENLITLISKEMECPKSLVEDDLEKLLEMRLLYHRRNSDERLELTDTGRLIAEEIMREV